jgi:hypothetical protein
MPAKSVVEHFNGFKDTVPLTRAGQANLMRHLASWSAANGIMGIRPWGVDLVAAGWEPFALFGQAMRVPHAARPALAALSDGLTHADADALP